MLIGAHVSIAGGFDKCIDRIVELGGNTLMTFVSPPRSLKVKDIPKNQIERYLSKKSRHNIGPHFFHGVYLINLAAQNLSLLKAGIDSLIFYQQLAGKIGAVGTIFHLGSHKESDPTAPVNQIVMAINFILDSSPKHTKLILENTAGQGGTVGKKLEDLADIIRRVGDKSKIGVCLDTQHLFASGIPLDKALDLFDRAIGLKYLSVLHVNDSRTDFGSHVDRHENLGQGRIGVSNLKTLLSDPRVNHVPKILEVPGSGNGPRKIDLDALKSLLLSR